MWRDCSTCKNKISKALIIFLGSRAFKFAEHRIVFSLARESSDKPGDSVVAFRLSPGNRAQSRVPIHLCGSGTASFQGSAGV